MFSEYPVLGVGGGNWKIIKKLLCLKKRDCKDLIMIFYGYFQKMGYLV